MKKRSITIKDIAAELGISPSTVSRALKDHFEISQKTIDAVKETAERLNYQPNSLALSLRYSKSHTIGVIVPEIVHFFFSTVISGIEDGAQSRGYNVIITQSNESRVKEISNIQTLYNNRVDGVLMSLSKETKDVSHIEDIIGKGLPIVMFDRVSDELDCSQVTVNDFQGAYNATKHLITKGYKKIAHLAGPSGLNVTNERLSGYKKALTDAGLQVDNNLIILDKYREEDSRKSVFELLKLHSADALFAFDDLAALESIKAAQQYGKNIPIDFGVVGFCNWQFTSLSNPTISTVEQPGFEMGQKAVELLINQIEEEEGKETSDRLVLETTLIERMSSRM